MNKRQRKKNDKKKMIKNMTISLNHTAYSFGINWKVADRIAMDIKKQFNNRYPELDHILN